MVLGLVLQLFGRTERTKCQRMFGGGSGVVISQVSGAVAGWGDLQPHCLRSLPVAVIDAAR